MVKRGQRQVLVSERIAATVATQGIKSTWTTRKAKAEAGVSIVFNCAVRTAPWPPVSVPKVARVFSLAMKLDKRATIICQFKPMSLPNGSKNFPILDRRLVLMSPLGINDNIQMITETERIIVPARLINATVFCHVTKPMIFGLGK